MIHVGLEVSSSLTSNPTGIQRYMSGVISGLSEQEDVSLTRLLKLSRYKKRRVMPVSDTPYRWYGLSPCSKREDINVIHCLDTTLPAWTNQVPIVATIHDLYLALHADHLDAETIRRKRKKIVDTCSKSAHIIVPSDAIRCELEEVFEPGVPISTVPHGIEPRLVNALSRKGRKKEINRNYILGFSGGIRKNLTLLAEAFCRSSAYAMGWCLAVVGKPSDEELRCALSSVPYERLNIYDQLSDEDLMTLYSNAGAVCYPSYYEGFGFPVLEGMAAGIPVVTSGHGATGEIANGYACLVDACSAESIKNGLDKAIIMNTKEIERARKYAISYTWSRAGEKIKDIYKTVLNKEL